jgi:ABC-type antimicrobial peptide transport system permease subunit
MTVVIRSRGEAASLVAPVRAAIREAEPTVPVPAVRHFSERVAVSVSLQRLFMRALVAFGLAALALASIGIYGLVRYTVETRTREFGIRMAIGAAPAGILALVAREVALLAALGVVLGVGAAFGAARLLGAMLVGLSATNLGVMAATVMTLIVVGAVAMLAPARTAMRTDPSVTLRQT